MQIGDLVKRVTHYEDSHDNYKSDAIFKITEINDDSILDDADNWHDMENIEPYLTVGQSVTIVTGWCAALGTVVEIINADRIKVAHFGPENIKTYRATDLTPHAVTPPTEPESNPFVRVVERREIVSGDHGIGSGRITIHDSHALSLHPAHYTPTELRRIARILTEIADVLEPDA